MEEKNENFCVSIHEICEHFCFSQMAQMPTDFFLKLVKNLTLPRRHLDRNEGVEMQMETRSRSGEISEYHKQISPFYKTHSAQFDSLRLRLETVYR